MRFSRIERALLGAVAVSMAACLPAAAQEGAVQDGSTAEQTIDVMNKIFGKHEGFRANHAKGVVVLGSFTPASQASAISKASIFAGPAIPVTARFSNATGVPAMPDGDKRANPHGLALKFKLPEGGEMDVVVNALKFFPVATGEEFRDLLTAVSQSGPDAAHPTPLENFVAAHPNVPKALGSAGTPSSLARQTFNGINAFVFVDKDGKRQPFRYIFEPKDGEEVLSAEEAGKQAPDFLMKDIVARVGAGPVLYSVKAQFAGDGDAINDATKPWPAERRVVTLGVLTLNRTVPDSAAAEKQLLFMPNALADGIEVSDDPLIDARVQSYAVSFSRRTQ